MRGVAGCGSRTQGATRSSAMSVGDIPERPHRHARRRPLRAHQRPRQRRQTTDPHLQRGTQGRALPVREPRSRRICQDLLINTSQGRGLAGSGSASLGAGYNQQGFALVVDALAVTAAPHPRGTARRESTPRDLAALCCQSGIRGCASKLLDTRLFSWRRGQTQVCQAQRAVSGVLPYLFLSCGWYCRRNPADD